MVNLSLIRQSNKHIDEASTPCVAVFVGGTAGIGKITLAEIAALGTDFKAYVIGRKESEQAFKTFLDDLHQANPTANIIWVEGQVSLLSDVKRVFTPEGLDISQSLVFYSRICFVENLLPLLRASRNARVISVLSGGLERGYLLNNNGLNVEQTGSFAAMATHMHMGIMGTLTLERLAEAKENHSIVFIHSHPGIVRTGNLFRGWGEGSWGPWFAAIFMDPILMLIAFSFKESAERYLYQVTSGAFGGRGPTLPGIVGQTTRGEHTGGLFLVNRTCDAVMNEKELAKLRVTAQEAVWEKAHQVISPYV
ncbi:uncharacterized protein K460DRAFT_314051 [Cucurbitaria berberidis CBS 394.84]|uniref:NAD(P)-binding protein n=1 Tax=Cucurbitaria berberidis CBS 394.84 TaxID=1168544 RepID=A0A9P4L9L1_9PLEO|nr:uncharacterized protein K460DRAFT_314051 [Cucurbitaria berberidis CBS 394.84]KAF1846533.1 hypothetical protein K460DRAFT_314051 [Cucurbitaria berberidis CBS 394.84]